MWYEPPSKDRIEDRERRQVYGLDGNVSYLGEISEKIELYNLKNAIILEDGAEDMSKVFDDGFDKTVVLFGLHHSKRPGKSIRKYLQQTSQRWKTINNLPNRFEISKTWSQTLRDSTNLYND